MTASESITRIDLSAEIARFPPDGTSGRRSEILLKTRSLRVLLVTMRAGTELHEHAAPGTITVQPIAGRFLFIVADEEREMEPGTLISVDGGVRHAVRAVADGTFLLTIAWPGDERER